MDALIANLPKIVMQLMAFALALSVHEAAHGWMAERRGDPTARWLGRITLNPIKHIDPIGTIAFPIVLALLQAPVFGWAKPVPFQPRNLRNPRRDPALVALAGPVSNFAVAFLSALVLLLLRKTAPGFDETWTRLMDPNEPLPTGILAPLIYLAYSCMLVDLVLAVFNLIPIPPLDGSHVLEAYLPQSMLATYVRLQPFGMLILFVVMSSRVLRYLLIPFLWFFGWLINL